MNKIPVAHFCPSYLPLSETFIYRYLSKFCSITPVVFAGKVENEELFPLKHSVYDCCHKRFTTRWIVNGVGNRVLGVSDLYRKTLLKIHRTRVLHAHFGPTGHSLLGIRKTLNIPLVTTFYGYDMSSLPKDPVWQQNYEVLFAEGDLFLVEGNHMKKDLVALGCPEEKVRIQHIAIDTDQFAFREREPKGNQPINLFFCGRFTEKKGLIYALKAFEAVLPEYPNLLFTIVGDGTLRPEIEKFIEEHGIKASVKLLGYQPQHVVAHEMEQADIFIHPSVTASNGDTEGGAPTIILEAQAAGVPVLATFHADIPEVVRHGESAILAKERDWRELSEGLLCLLKNQQKWASMGRAGRKHVEQHYDIKNEVKNLEEIYRMA